jgi:hypothetical protein
VITHSPTRKGEDMKNEITKRWVALAPLALIAIALFSAWS